MPVFDSLQRCGFDGIQFPIKSISIKGRYRHFEHEYLRVPGAVIEKLERALYDIEIQAVFDTNIRGFGTLWPNGVNALRNRYERGVTGPLVIPTIGTVPAFQPAWEQNIDMAKVRSGETIKLNFKEDQTSKFLAVAVVKTQQTAMEDALGRFNVTRAQILGVPDNDVSLFDAINQAANNVLAIKDQADLSTGLLAAKIANFTRLMNEADTAIQSIQHPENHPVLDAFLELWNSGVVLATNLAESPRGPRTFVTPRVMSVSDVAAAVYDGSTERASEILMNNTLPDAFAIPAGTKIIYFVDAGLIAA